MSSSLHSGTWNKNKKSNFFMTVVTIMKSNIGVGILGMVTLLYYQAKYRKELWTVTHDTNSCFISFDYSILIESTYKMQKY